MKKHTPPFELKELKIEVTHDCQLRCSHCSSMAKTNSSRVMDWNTCKRIIDEAAEMGVVQLTFSGGEPLLWNPLEDAVSLANSHGMEITIYTTGNVVNAQQKLKRLASLGLSKIIFSIFGANQKNHELITGVTGSYDCSMDAIKECVKLNLDVEFHFVPSVNNYQSLGNIAILAHEVGVSRISVLRLVPQGRAASDMTQLLSHKQNLELRKSIIKLRKSGFDIRTGSPYNFLMLRDRPACCSGIDRLTIGPDLYIFPCDAFKHIPPAKLGISPEFSCLKNNSLKECWEKSPYLQKIRQYLTTPFADSCKDCKSLEKCLSGCMAQKFHIHNELRKCSDPMCLLRETQI